MSMRVHTTHAKVLSMSVLDTEPLADLYGEGFEDTPGPVLVLEDTGNMEALVLIGTADDFIQLAHDILAKVQGDSREYV